MQRAVYAGIDPANTVRQAGQAIAYTALLAQEGLGEGLAASSTTPESAAPTGTTAPLAATPPSDPAVPAEAAGTIAPQA
jgi:hypothetical protein